MGRRVPESVEGIGYVDYMTFNLRGPLNGKLVPPYYRGVSMRVFNISGLWEAHCPP